MGLSFLAVQLSATELSFQLNDLIKLYERFYWFDYCSDIDNIIDSNATPASGPDNIARA